MGRLTDCVSTRLANHHAVSTPVVASNTMIVAKALILGLNPKRTLEYTTIGKVVEPGPDTKLAMTRSSKDKVKANNQPETKAGAIMGKVTKKNTFQGGAPKSLAASSRETSISRRRELTTTATNAVQKVT